MSLPALTVDCVFLELDRRWGTHFFDTRLGGDPLLWQQLFWFFAHPWVYIVFLPATGMVSMIIPVFSRRPIVGYPYVVYLDHADGRRRFRRLAASHVLHRHVGHGDEFFQRGQHDDFDLQRRAGVLLGRDHLEGASGCNRCHALRDGFYCAAGHWRPERNFHRHHAGRLAGA